MKERIFTTKKQGRVLVEAGLPISTAIGFRDKYLDQLHSMEDDAGRIGLIEHAWSVTYRDIDEIPIYWSSEKLLVDTLFSMMMELLKHKII